MDNSYQIITDVTVDLTPELLEGFDLKVIPMPVTLDGRTFHHHLDYREMSAEDFWAGIRAGKEVSTAQINLLTYLRAFLPPLRAGRDLVYFCFSSGLSGTIQAANMVLDVLREKFPQRRLVCIDTLSATVGQAYLVHQALCKQRDEDCGLEELTAWAEEAKLHVAHRFVVEDLEHLHRGGRLSKAAAVAGTMLQVKPLLAVDDEGRLTVRGKARGSGKAYQALADQVRDTGLDLSEQTVFVCHSANPEGAEKLKALLAPLVRDVLILPVGPVVGAHTGVGLVGVGHWCTKR